MFKLNSAADVSVVLTFKGKDIDVVPGEFTVDSREEADFVAKCLSFVAIIGPVKNSVPDAPKKEEKKEGVVEEKKEEKPKSKKEDKKDDK